MNYIFTSNGIFVIEVAMEKDHMVDRVLFQLIPFSFLLKMQIQFIP